MTTPSRIPDTSCAITRSLGVLGQRWTFLILREALAGTTRFTRFRDELAIPADVLAERLATLVEHGVLTKRPYREPGHRVRHEYHLTPAGRDLEVMVRGLQQWGDRHLPWPGGPTVECRRRDTGEPVHVGFVDAGGREVARADLDLVSHAMTFPRPP
ncbi:MAG: transcriptional regulator [Conexibacter sp.]|nr:transcriptional regulator [Conexibacter sp.]